VPNLSQSHIGQIAVVCKDVGRASAFYRDVLGVRHLFDAGPNLSFFDSSGVRLMLTTAEGAESRFDRVGSDEPRGGRRRLVRTFPDLGGQLGTARPGGVPDPRQPAHGGHPGP